MAGCWVSALAGWGRELGWVVRALPPPHPSGAHKRRPHEGFAQVSVRGDDETDGFIEVCENGDPNSPWFPDHGRGRRESSRPCSGTCKRRPIDRIGKVSGWGRGGLAAYLEHFYFFAGERYVSVEVCVGGAFLGIPVGASLPNSGDDLQ